MSETNNGNYQNYPGNMLPNIWIFDKDRRISRIARPRLLPVTYLINTNTLSKIIFYIENPINKFFIISVYFTSSDLELWQTTKKMVKAKKFIYVKEFEGEVNSTNFQLVEEELPELKNGEFLAKALYLSVDPYMRPYMARYPLGVTMIGGQVAK